MSRFKIIVSPKSREIKKKNLIFFWIFRDLAGNQIDTLHEKPFAGLGQLHDLLLSYNEIETLPFDAFTGIPKLQLLDLEGNNINFIHEDAFKVFTQLEDL